MLFRLALRRANPAHLKLVTTLGSGDDAIMDLAGEGIYADRAIYPFPDLVVLDLKMPGQNGFDVLAWIREHRLPVLTVVYSDSDEPEDIERALALGAFDYQRKAECLLTTAEWLGRVDENWGRWHAGDRSNRRLLSPQACIAEETLLDLQQSFGLAAG